MTILLCYRDTSKYIWWWWWGGGLGDLYFFLHISSCWVKIRLHTENQLPGLPGSALKVVLTCEILPYDEGAASLLGNNNLGVNNSFLRGLLLVGDMVWVWVAREYLKHCDMILAGSPIYSETPRVEHSRLFHF